MLVACEQGTNFGFDPLDFLFIGTRRSPAQNATEGAEPRIEQQVEAAESDGDATMLSASGYEVVDLGVNVVPMEAIKAAESGGASIIGLSALMTTSMPYQKEVVDLLDELGQRDDFFVIVGGGPVTREYADDINANGWAPDAAAAVQVCDQLGSGSATPANTGLVYKAAE